MILSESQRCSSNTRIICQMFDLKQLQNFTIKCLAFHW